MGQARVRTTECVGIFMAFAQPVVVIATHLIAMLGTEVDMVIAVERQIDPVIRIVPPARRLLLIVAALIGHRFQRLLEFASRPGASFGRIVALHDGRTRIEILQMALAQQRRPVAIGAQQIDKGVGPQ